jgi:hypothetical protein
MRLVLSEYTSPNRTPKAHLLLLPFVQYLLLRQWRCNFYKYDASVSEEAQLPIMLCLLGHFLITAHFFASWPFDNVCDCV